MENLHIGTTKETEKLGKGMDSEAEGEEVLLLSERCRFVKDVYHLL